MLFFFFNRTPSYYTIRLGDHNRGVGEGTEQDIQAKRVIKHENYSPNTINNDIALIQLSKPATLNARVGTVCLPKHNEMVPTSSKCFITGKKVVPPLGSKLLKFQLSYHLTKDKKPWDIYAKPKIVSFELNFFCCNMDFYVHSRSNLSLPALLIWSQRSNIFCLFLSNTATSILRPLILGGRITKISL